MYKKVTKWGEKSVFPFSFGNASWRSTKSSLTSYKCPGVNYFHEAGFSNNKGKEY